MSKSLEFDHAKHDEEIALWINREKKSTRWIIIVSFYSALHYLRGKIFPLTEIAPTGGVATTYDSFDHYHYRNRIPGKSVHDCLVDLTYKEVPLIAVKYNMLYNQSITMRYKFDEPLERDAEAAIKFLLAIKKECLKPQI